MSLPIVDFLVGRMQEFDPEFELRKGTAFNDLFIQPLSLIVQPISDEAEEIYLNQSLKRILELEEPDIYPEAAVDEIVQNYYVYRREGNTSGGTVRLLYTEAQDVNFVAGALEFTNTDSLIYVNRNNISITANQMSNQLDGEFFYLDVQVLAEAPGTEYDVAANEIIAVSDENPIRVFNSSSISGGADRETNTEYINRAQNSIGERSLNTGKGANAIFFENFSAQLEELKTIGFGDPEMMRDIQFNYHIGGRIDAWVKTVSIQNGFFDVVGLTIDTTRRLSTSTNLVMTGTTSSSLGVQNIDVEEHAVRAFDIKNVDQPARFFSFINIEDGVDLSLGQFISISLDGNDFKDIKVSGSNPATTQPGEIATRINVGLGLSVATIAVNPIIVSRRRTANTPGDNQKFISDPTEGVFRNVAPGDIFAILVGDNQAAYTVASVINDNELLMVEDIEFGETDINYRVSRPGTYIKIETQTSGVDSSVSLRSPTIGTDALPLVIGLPSTSQPYVYPAVGETEYQEAVDFNVELNEGTVDRIIGPSILANQPTGYVANSIYFEDNTADIFLNVEAGDILTISSATTNELQKDYRVLEKINNNRLRLDAFFNLSETAIEYRVNRTGIKDGDTIKYTFDYNPLSIDIGDRIVLDDYGRVTGVRPGRETTTITDTALLYITSVELIDPVSGEPIGEFLEGKGGFGRGAYGQGGYGLGALAQWVHNVNKPELRFSAREDSFVIIAIAFIGQSFRVNYQYVPEVVTFQDFVESDAERVLDGDVLVKHFIPAVVDVEVNYTTDPNNPNTPTKEEVLDKVTTYINKIKAGEPLDASDIVDVIYQEIDPSRDRNVIVEQPIKMSATVYNTDASLTIINDQNRLSIPEEFIPAFSKAPLSPRTAHWIAGTITLNETRVTTAGIA